MMRSIGVGALVVASAVTVLSAVVAQTVTFESDMPKQSPASFEFGVAGDGGPGLWQIVDDRTATGGKALAQVSADPTPNRFLVAIYNRASFADGEITTRCKPVSGKTDQACGVIIRAVDPKNYYIARANALEDNVRFYRVSNSERQQIATDDNVKVAGGEWHTLTLQALGDRFTVIFDGRTLYSISDAATPEPRPRDGRAGLWVKADSVTHFDRIEIKRLP